MMFGNMDGCCEGQTTGSNSNITISHDELDNRIVAACNELMKQKALTAKQKVDNRNERARLHRALIEQTLLLDGRLRTSRHTKDLTDYQAACEIAFLNADGVTIPAFASLRQAQLCLNLHNMTVLDNQIAVLKRQRKQETSLLELERNKLPEESATSEVLLLNHVVTLEREIRDLQSHIAGLAAATISLSSASNYDGKVNNPSPPRSVIRMKSSDSNNTVDTMELSLEEEAEEDGEKHEQQQQQGNSNLYSRLTRRFSLSASFAAPTWPKTIVETAMNNAGNAEVSNSSSSSQDCNGQLSTCDAIDSLFFDER
jgi:hypothetical protein